ncbi:hypothetical protein HY58_09950 [Flavihumibacter sp. ZG627]|nr:hypothetical protein HY58_09950 [Flavihumibacter sp. ZG627]
MNKVSYKKYFTHCRFSLAGIFVMAVLLLCVSCPLKRVLQANFKTSSLAGSKQESNRHIKSTTSISTDACATVTEQVIVSEKASQQNLLTSFNLPAATAGEGFAIHYYLCGTASVFADCKLFHLSALPIFLQQQRLLI